MIKDWKEFVRKSRLLTNTDHGDVIELILYMEVLDMNLSAVWLRGLKYPFDILLQNGKMLKCQCKSLCQGSKTQSMLGKTTIKKTEELYRLDDVDIFLFLDLEKGQGYFYPNNLVHLQHKQSLYFKANGALALPRRGDDGNDWRLENLPTYLGKLNTDLVTEQNRLDQEHVLKTCDG